MSQPLGATTATSVLAALLLCGWSASESFAKAAEGDSPFPVRASANGRYLENATGKPFLLHGDTAWSLIVQLTKEEAEEYLENRRRKGFNSIIVELIEYKFAENAPANKYGDAPFTTPGDFSTPNEAYFAHADWVIQKAMEKGILVVLNPCYIGYSSNFKTSREGWTKAILANGPEKCRYYGRYLGERYKDYPNIIWQAGGDTTIPAGSDLEENWLELLRGVKEHAPDHHWTAHWYRFTTAVDQPTFAPHMTVDNAYGGNRTYIQTLRAYNRASPKPIFLNEAYYEDDRLVPGAGTPQIMRAQAYWTLLSGASGHHFGSYHIWGFGAVVIGGQRFDWRTGMESQGSQEMVHVKRLFEARRWYDLVPDQDHTVVTSGYGTFGKDDRTPGGDYVTAARTSDGRLVIAYVPSTGTEPRTIAVNMARLSGPAHARWYNPTSGRYTDIAASPLANIGDGAFTTPGDNDTGTNDWVLVLETAISRPSPAGGEDSPACAQAFAKQATGPLRVHPANPRYFTVTDGSRSPDGSLRAVYLTGSHTWNNQQQIEGFRVARSPDPLTGKINFVRFLDFLDSHHHNFYRHWIFEFAWDPGPKVGPFTVEPHPWPPTGPGTAGDDKPKLDLSKFDESYFERLRSRLSAARDRGIYASIMLFESSFGGRVCPGHPFHPDNNINGVNGGSTVRFHTLESPAVVRLQEAYVRKVVDTVNDLENGLYDVCNEPGQESWDWCVHLCKFIKEYQAAKPKQHPVGLASLADKSQSWIARNDLPLDSPFDWISPGGWAKNSPANVWGKDTPTNDGRKVILADTDHIWPVAPQRGWVWKCFARGHQPILMDWYDCRPGWPSSGISSEEQEAMRQTMGHTRVYANRMNLAAMTPRNDLASSGYCLAAPGREYLAYLPDGGAVTVDLSAVRGPLAFEWFNPRTGTATNGGPVEGGAVVYLKANGGKKS